MTAASPDETTHVACLTPPGAGAIATLALHGPLAWPIVRGLFRSGPRPGKELPPEPIAGKHWIGRLGEEPEGALADEVVLLMKRTTPTCVVEIHSHGGREVVRFLLEIIASRGAQVCMWQDLEQRTATDGEQVIQARALIALVEAPTARTAAILLDQYHGAFFRSITDIRLALAANDLDDAKTRLGDLVRLVPLGRHLTAPWRVALIGAPNVGKSSLVNALAGFPRSVVAPTPGTTRDVVTTLIAIDGWPVELADTAGVRSDAEPLEQLGIERALAAADGADLCLWVLDASTPAVFPLKAAKHVHFVVNKIDLTPLLEFDQLAGAIPVSATLGDGVADLCRVLGQWLVPFVPSPGAAVPFTPFLCDRINEAHQLLTTGQAANVLALLDSCMM